MSKEILFVTPEYAKVYNHLGEVEALLARVRDIMADFKAANVCDLEAVDRQIVTLREVIDEKKRALSELAAAEVKEMTALFDQLAAKRRQVTEQLSTLLVSVHDIRQEIDTLKQAINSINIYGLDRILDVIERFTRMTPEERELLARLFGVTILSVARRQG